MMFVIVSGVHSMRIWASQLFERVKFWLTLLVNCESEELKKDSELLFEKASPSL